MRLFGGLVRFLAHLSTKQHLVLVLEDQSWASESTLQLIHYLVRHLSAHPALLLTTFRTDAVRRKHPLQALQRELKQEDLLTSLHLDPLSLTAVEALVAEMSGAGAATAPLARGWRSLPICCRLAELAQVLRRRVRLQANHGDHARNRGQVRLQSRDVGDQDCRRDRDSRLRGK